MYEIIKNVISGFKKMLFMKLWDETGVNSDK